MVRNRIEANVSDTLRASRTFPGINFLVTDTAVLGTRLTVQQMQDAGWFQKRPPVAIVQNGECVSMPMVDRFVEFSTAPLC